MKKLLPLLLLLAPRAALAEPPAPDTDPGAGLRTAGWIVAGAGATAVAGSVVFLALADREHGEAVTPEGVNHSHLDAFRSYLTTSRVLGLVGLAAVGTGITLVVVGNNREPQVSVTTGVGQIALSGTF